MKNKLIITKFLYFAFFLFSLQLFLYADIIHFSGTVQDESNQAIANVQVSLYTRNNLKTRTDEYGNFELTGNSDIASVDQIKKESPVISLNGCVLNVFLKSISPIWVFIYDFNGKKLDELHTGSSGTGIKKIKLPISNLAFGVYLISITYGGGRTIVKCVVSEGGLHAGKIYSVNESENRKSVVSRLSQNNEFSDILVVTADGTQTVRRPVKVLVEDSIKIKLMPQGIGYITPTIPVFTDKGGIGDVTTYGSVSDPEFSQGGACNYGNTGISYYAAINVNQIPGDLKGDWQEGRICGRCARVRIITNDGEVRSTIVRIMDRCADENCGIDLGGAPAGVLMKTQPGRYSGEWEWVSCEGVEGVSDGPAALYVKPGSGKYWSLVQVRNGPGAVSEIRVKKVGNAEWQNLPWATEAENFFRLPVELLQDIDDWEIEVIWESGSNASVLLSGEKLALENMSYPLE